MPMQFRGQVVLQSWLLGTYYIQQKKATTKFEKSKKTPKDSAVLAASLFWNTAAMGGGTIAIWTPWFRIASQSVVGSVATRVGSYGGVLIAEAAPIAAGIAIGATAGTAISGAIWGEEGAQTALGFYSGGTLPGTEAPDLTDYQYIFKPTAPGGPVSLYDVAEAGLKGTLRAADQWRKNYPSFYL